MSAQIGMSLILFAVFIAIAVFYLTSLQRLLEAISEENRKMPPGQVWLLLIPFFNMVWHFIVVWNISDSIRNECIKLYVPQDTQRPTFLSGILCMSLYLVSIAIKWMVTIWIASSLVGLLSVGFFIAYWVQVNQYKKLILANRNNFLFDAELGQD